MSLPPLAVSGAEVEEKMGRQVRMVPPDWEHPKRADGRYQPMHDRSYKEEADEWQRECVLWSLGKHPAQAEYESARDCAYYWEWTGEPPEAAYYMPDFSEGSRTHLQMYETTSEGTPISPVMETPETLARWLTDNNASAFGSRTATYEQWLAVCKGGYAPSAVLTIREDGTNEMESGVAAMASMAAKEK